jgi:outer membrane protein assembly factor BamA
MPKIKHLILGCLFCVLVIRATAQSYLVHYRVTGADTVIKEQLQDKFTSRMEANGYLNNLPALLQNKGYITASVDSLRIDSTEAFVQLFFGEQYKWAKIRTLASDEDILQAIHWPRSSFSNTGVNFSSLQTRQEQILDYLEENGYPFARIYLDSISINENEVAALLRINRGPVYKMDSIQITGDAKISNEFLQRYLELPNGGLYNRKKLQEVSKKLKQVTYVEEQQPANLMFTATGLVLNLYLKSKKSSQANVLVGFLPNSNPAEAKKFLVTGEANVLLRNALGAGETIGLNWQQLQSKSPRLNVLYEHPFVFKSPLGLNFSFDMFRKDSSYVNINMQLGANYILGTAQSVQIFLQRRQTIVNGMDTLIIRQTKRLPSQGDVSSNNLGISYLFNNTNYRFNPQKGNEFIITASAGKKKLKKNNQILELKDPSFKFESLYDTVKLNTYQFRLNASAAHYFKTGKQTTLKTGINTGIFQSGNYFLNEFFMIGGYKLLRGFTEESLFVTQYAVGTIEYRYLIGLNSNFFAFADGGWTKNPLQENSTHTYFGTGLGLSFETKAGIFNLAWAVGKRNDAQLNLRQSKIHFGFVNYF